MNAGAPARDLGTPCVFISGLHSSANPLPGIGVARSLRAAFPNATLIGVDYSSTSSGLHWPDFDYVEIPGGWHELDLAHYASTIRSWLDRGCFWISCLDLETRWLSEVIPSHPRLLVPPCSALVKVAKPCESVAELLELRVPPFFFLSADDSDIHRFATQHSWRLWLKGPYYSALPVRSWAEFQVARARLAHLWSTKSRLFLQAHIDGPHESIIFAGAKGRLLGLKQAMAPA